MHGAHGIVGWVVIASLMVVSPALGLERHYHGIGTNTTLGADFALRITLDTSGAPGIVGEFDATEDPGDVTVCGKGQYSGTISGTALTFSFVDEDDDPGCGGGSGTSFSISATLSGGGEVLSGSFSAGGEQGTFTVYLADRWVGSGFNDPFSAPWVAEFYLSQFSPNRIAGELDATQAPGDQVICGRGIFVGIRAGNQIEFSFTSNDSDPGCGFDYGDVNDFIGTFSADGTRLNGSYLIDNGQDGTWSVALEKIFADGFETGTASEWSSLIP